MRIETSKVGPGIYDVIVNGNPFDTVRQSGRKWISEDDSTIIAGTLSKALDSVVWNAICQMNSSVGHLQRRALHFRNTKRNEYMANIFAARHFAMANHLFDSIRPGVK